MKPFLVTYDLSILLIPALQQIVQHTVQHQVGAAVDSSLRSIQPVLLQGVQKMLYDGVTNSHILIPIPVCQSISFFSFVHYLSSPPLVQISLTFSHFLKPFAQLCRRHCNILFNQHMKLCSRRLFFLLLIDPFRRYFNRSMMHSARELQSVSDHLLLTFVTFQ